MRDTDGFQLSAYVWKAQAERPSLPMTARKKTFKPAKTVAGQSLGASPSLASGTGSAWRVTPEGGIILRHEMGEEYLEARVHQGGNGRWTRYVGHYKRGRVKKGRAGNAGYRIHDECLNHSDVRQSDTQHDALADVELMIALMKQNE